LNPFQKRNFNGGQKGLNMVEFIASGKQKKNGPEEGREKEKTTTYYRYPSILGGAGHFL